MTWMLMSTVHCILTKPVFSDHLCYVTIFQCSLGKSHKTGLSVFFIFSVFLWCPIICLYLFWVSCCDVRYDFQFSYLTHVLFTSFLFAYVTWCLTHIVLCFYFVFLRLLYPMCQFLWIVLFWLPLRYSLMLIYDL